MSRSRLGATALTLVLLLAACGGTAATTTAAPATTTTTAAATTTTEGASEETTTTAAPIEMMDIKVSLIPILDFGPFYLGLQEGIFEKHGLNVEYEELFSSPGLVSSVTSGASDIATTSATQAVTGISNGLPIKIVSNGGFSPPTGSTEILVLPDSDIQSFADLAGKTVSTVALQGLFHLGTLSAVENAGGDWKTVEAIPGQQPELADALAAGRVDAIVIQEPFLSAFVRDYGFRSLGNPYGDLGYSIPSGVWITSIEQAEAEPEKMRRFRAAMAEANQFAVDNDALLRELIPTFTSLTAEQVADISLPIFDGNLPQESLTAMGTSMLNFGWLRYIPSYNQIVWEDTGA
jgi:NitT/TauT family transport system substrate-binding protein